MKKIIPFVIVVLIAIAVFFGLQHFVGNTAAEVPEEVTLPELTIETSSVQEEATEPEVTPTPEPTATSEPTATPEPAAEVDTKLYICKDKELDKTCYTAASEEILLARVRENISAEQAVDATECKMYGTMMVVSHDDERIIEGFTAYDLIKDEKSLEVTFNRDGSKLFVCGEKGIEPSKKDNKSFKGLPDKMAYGAWICSEHQAFKASALVYEGYPESQRETTEKLNGYRGPFAVADGFSAKVLKSIVLINTEADRYDWVLVMCDCGEGEEEVSSSDNGTGGNGGSGENTPEEPNDDNGNPEYSPEPDEDEVYNPEYSPEPDEDEVYGDDPVVSDDQDAIVRPPVEDNTTPETDEEDDEPVVSDDQDAIVRPPVEDTTPEYSPEVDVYDDVEPEYSEPVNVYSSVEEDSEPAVEAEVSSEQDIFVRPEVEPAYSEPVAVYSVEEESEPEYSEPVNVYSSVEEDSEPEYSEPVNVYSSVEEDSEPAVEAEVSSEQNIFAR